MITSSQESVGDRHLQTSRLGRAPVTFVIISRRHLPPPAGGGARYTRSVGKECRQMSLRSSSMPRITNGMQHRYTQSSRPGGVVWNTVCNTGTSVMSTSSTIGHDADVDGPVGVQTHRQGAATRIIRHDRHVRGVPSTARLVLKRMTIREVPCACWPRRVFCSRWAPCSP